MSLVIVPVSLKQANDFVGRLHRHHPPVVSHRFSIGAMDTETQRLVGVAIVGRPVARMIDQERVVEVTRLCADGTRNACSLLYGAAARAALALGYCAIITYTLSSEDGASLRASGWWGEANATPGREWNCPSRPRDVRPSTMGPKWRWLRLLADWHETLPGDEEEASLQADLFA